MFISQGQQLQVLLGSWVFTESATGATDGFFTGVIASDLHLSLDKMRKMDHRNNCTEGHHYVVTVSVQPPNAGNSQWNCRSRYFFSSLIWI